METLAAAKLGIYRKTRIVQAGLEIRQPSVSCSTWINPSLTLLNNICPAISTGKLKCTGARFASAV